MRLRPSFCSLPLILLLATASACAPNRHLVRLDDGEVIGGVIVSEDREALYFHRAGRAAPQRVPKHRVIDRARPASDLPIAGVVIMSVGGLVTAGVALSDDGCDSSESDFCGLGRGLAIMGGLGVVAIGGIVALIEVATSKGGWRWERGVTTADVSEPDETPRVRVGGTGVAVTW